MVLAAWILLFLLGCSAQSLILSQKILAGLFLYFLDGSLAVLLTCALRKPTYSGVQDDRPTSIQRIGIASWIVPILAIVLLGVACYTMAAGTDFYSLAFYSWLAALVFLALAAIHAAWHDIRHFPKRALISLAVLMIVSAIIGMYRLTTVPPTVHGDEGMVGLYARMLLQGDLKTFFSTAWYSIPQFFFAIPAAGLYLFGNNLWGLRMSTVCMGILCMIPFFLLLRAWWGDRPAFLGGLLLAANSWFVHLQHCGVNYIQATFFTIALLAVWAYANNRRSVEFLLAGGAVMGLSLLSYQANHLLPILWIASQVWLFALRKIPLRWFVLSTALPILLALLVISPLLVHDFKTSGKSEVFHSRSSGVGIWTPMNLQHLNGVFRADGDWSLILREQTKRALLSPLLYPDTSVQYQGKMPFLDRCTAVLFMMGIVIAGYRFFELRWSVPVLWIVGILLAGGAMTVDAPFYPRLTGAATLFFIPISGVLSLVVSPSTKKYEKTVLVFSLIPIVFSAGVNLSHYFITYAGTISPQSVHYAQTQMAYLIRQRDPGETIYVLNGPHFSFNSGTVRFLAEPRKGLDVQDPLAIPNDRPCSIFIDASLRSALPTLKERFPAYTIQSHDTLYGYPMFIAITQD